jgi:hypothetical protein
VLVFLSVLCVYLFGVGREAKRGVARGVRRRG